MGNDLTTTEQYVFFWGGWPSQWHKCSFVVDAITYNCSEQYMMAEKARIFGDSEALEKILASTNPRQQKALGRKVRNFDADRWNSLCRDVVYSANLAKFGQNPSLAKLLHETENRRIVEASPTDRIWGIGLTADDPRATDPSQWRGTNWLGEALMMVRETIRGRAVA